MNETNEETEQEVEQPKPAAKEVGFKSVGQEHQRRLDELEARNHNALFN